MSTRIIESPRERMLAILTNNFVPCNGRWPMLILMASLFMVLVIQADANTCYCRRCSWNGCNWCYYDINRFLGTIKTALKGVPTHYTLELPPYRKPKVWNTIVRATLDKSVYVLKRAVVALLLH